MDLQSSFDKYKINWQLTEIFINSVVASNIEKNKLNNKENQFLSEQDGRVICQKQINNDQILRRVEIKPNQCIDEIVDINTGKVIKQTPLDSCDSSCNS
ncbi:MULTISPECIES: hypothetical protein [Nostoc]|uniref:Uncharacterized protein n=2 Tax=Nostoc TaxID=1177 RepID=A0ABR8IH45_9NOSO|nr:MULTISPECIES: hypothetical protein [Nostoc]MBD2564353.1 hypothetical protein [Nostoc linckia FACHB-391]MBD2650141.1 hypothetical protein [Nostoc foliaceum FACHB-393]